MATAVLSDVHGVLPALEAVLAEPDVREADLIVLTGDIAAGPLPVETLDRLLGLGDRVVWVRGNADRTLVDLARGGTTTIPDPIGPSFARIRWTCWPDCRTPSPASCPASGRSCSATGRRGTTTRWCWWTPGGSDGRRCWPTWTNRCTRSSAGTPTCLSPGSCSVGSWSTRAAWACRTGVPARTGRSRRRRRRPAAAYEFRLRRRCAQIAATSAYDKAAEWADYFVRARAGDDEVLTVFGPRDGRAQ